MNNSNNEVCRSCNGTGINGINRGEGLMPRCDACNGSGEIELMGDPDEYGEESLAQEFAVRLSEYGVAMAHRHGEKARVLAEVLQSMFDATQPPQDERGAWTALTDRDRERAMNSMPNMLEGFMKTWGWLHFAKAIEEICREKNFNVAASAPAQQAESIKEDDAVETLVEEGWIWDGDQWQRPPEQVNAAPAEKFAPITAAMMRDDGGDSPTYCLMVAFRTEREATAALSIVSGEALIPAQAKPAPAQQAGRGEPDQDWWNELISDISAIDCRYRGDPSYDHDAYWMREHVTKMLEKRRDAK